ncbi:MAG: cytochrome P450 [Actinomycetota bacterium]
MSALDIYDPDIYLDGPPHDVFAELRRTQPVFFQEMTGEPGYWAVLRHADVTHVAKEPNLFSAYEAGVMLENLAPEALDGMRNMLLAMDPPRHLDYRRPLLPTFKARVIAQMEDRIRGICRRIMTDAAEKRDVEFVHDVTAPLPTQVIGELMGLPRDDWDAIHAMAERMTRGQDPDTVDPADAATEVGGATLDMVVYGMELAQRRRAEEPREDVTSLILGTEFGGEPMNDVDFGSFFVQLVTAGNDTTQGMLSNGLYALLQHPDELAKLRADPSLTASAVEEILRYEGPLHYFRRTATADTVLHDVDINAGDKVAMIYTSANRDEAVFDDPNLFDIARTPNPHLSFGIAEHFCLGVHIARLEGRVFFEELLATFPTIELTGEPRRTRSNLNNGFKALPVRLSMR